MSDFSAYTTVADKCCEYLTASPDPFHAVMNSVTGLEAAGYTHLSKREPFTDKIVPGGKYYYTVNRTSLVAFCVGPEYQPGNGFKVIGGHTDSPNLKVKPQSKRSAANCLQLGVECYGGGLWHTWFDRDLGISGRVLVREGEKIVQKLVKVDKPVARVSNLAIHLASAEERRVFKVNKEDHMSPIIATQGKNELENGLKEQLTGGVFGSWAKSQDSLLLALVAKELDIEVTDIADFELNLFDTQAATLGGINSEFLYSARLDNLATCFTAVEGIIGHSDSEDFLTDTDVSVVALFDHEEVGSESAQGAGSPIMGEAIRRIATALNNGEMNPDLYAAVSRKSLIFSIDQAHAMHPNYSQKHEKGHAPTLNGGMVIKSNCNQRYATNTISSLIFREICRKANVPTQSFIVRQDCGCGSTIGPMVSAATGIRCVDAGMPQLSMHSCREMMGIVDLTYAINCFKSFLKHFREIDDNLEG
mmetsp:Transcript_11665/g.16882  ORF Transcript_11665/g.16882 Transcript_11665/m.16882 type:complete len:475 (-) Transcript_11665:155-1579(-)|eukprot:CAMPEP_0195511458 /NCGR_PEP_ID=MMETSP0794_2-20130614/3767_1 /TAXON_ID=515487 /ORGANISM="Stephanopyxis turris, Strain CCMP 815" /LENGTH=474 /DNA_ID=CAMNT_0040639053 /DNA_START=129 /DNA_END=1553 /DNA_ORIENTATION=+